MVCASSVERDVDVALAEDGNAAVATIVDHREFELDELFQGDQLRLWQDASGWNDFLREEEDGDVAYYSVNRLDDGSSDEWIWKLRVGEQAVRDGIRHYIEDPDAGRFVRCTEQFLTCIEQPLFYSKRRCQSTTDVMLVPLRCQGCRSNSAR